MTMKSNLAMDALKFGDQGVASSTVFRITQSTDFSIVDAATSLSKTDILDVDQDLFDAKGSSLHRYRSLELLEEAATCLDKPAHNDLVTRNDIISYLRIRWQPTYRIHKEDWPNIYQQIDQYCWPSSKNPTLKKSARVVRRFVEAVMWVADTGAKWSYLPRSYGRWQVVQDRFLKWLDLGYWSDIARCLSNKDQRSSLMILMENHYAIRRSNALASVILGRKNHKA